MTEQPPSSTSSEVNNAICLIVTGGTLDKDYNTLSGQLGFSETHLPHLLRQANITQAISLDVVMLKDSLEMTQQDREAIAEACLNAPQQRIVITHGTDTIAKTAEHLAGVSNLASKTIVLTGAMRPFMLGQSDASFNLGSAIMAADLSPSGVYIVMNGQRFEANHVYKNTDMGVFERR